MSVPIAHGREPGGDGGGAAAATSRRARASRSHGLRTGPKAEFSFEEPIANSSWFVLPSSVAPALGELRDGGRGVRRPVALEDPRAGLARHALGAEEVLDGERDAGERRAVGVGRARRRRPTGRR